MLVKCKNADLYRSWISYLERTSGDQHPAQIRTTAFFNSQAARPIPLM